MASECVPILGITPSPLEGDVTVIIIAPDGSVSSDKEACDILALGVVPQEKLSVKTTLSRELLQFSLLRVTEAELEDLLRWASTELANDEAGLRPMQVSADNQSLLKDILI
ncbi:hypothetical protein ACTXT7_007490 [Hymenolepis weldensis]